MKKLIVGIDVGGTKIAGGLVTPKGQMKASLTLPTRADKGFKESFHQVLDVIERLIHRADGKQNVAGIGICAPDINPKTGSIAYAPNLPGWRNVPLTHDIQKHFGLPTKSENDANAAGLAETLFGAARGHAHVFYVTVSTGIGTGIIIDKKIYQGKNGVAGEGGHVTLDARSPYLCGCGSRGCIEALAAGPAMARRARVRLEQEHTTPSLLRELSHGDLGRINPKMIHEAARRGDSVAKFIIDETGFYLGAWLGGMLALLDSEVVVIGGGVARIGKPLFDKIRATIPQFSIAHSPTAKTPVLPAKLQKDVGVFGAASLFLPTGKDGESS